MPKINPLILTGLSLALLGLLILAGCLWVEFILIPNLLTKAGYTNAVVIHIVIVVIIELVTIATTAWLTRRNIFEVQEKLVTQHLNNLTSSIEQVVSGAWTNQASVEKTVFMAGARLGYDVREQLPPPPTRGEILTGLGTMTLPEPKKLLGQPPEVVDDMGRYMDNLENRRVRLGVEND